MTNALTGSARPTKSRRAMLLALTGAATGLAAASAFSTTRGAQSTPVAAPGDTESLADVTLRIVAAANAFLDTLSESERQSALFDFSDTAQRQRWSNLPEGLYERAGLMWGNLGEEPRSAWLGLMQATLSAEGYTRVLAEWQADAALAAEDTGALAGGGGTPPGGGNPPGDGGAQPAGTPPGGGPPGGGALLYGPQYYWVAIIGAPSETDPWQWQFGGHHVTINATVVGPNLTLTPSFIGVQPATYTDAAGATVRPLGDIEDDAFALINLLDATQQEAAILGDTSIDLVLGPGQDGRVLQPEGLPASQMTADQQAALRQLIGHYTGLAHDAAAATRMAEVEATLGETYLVWYGPTTEGSAAYFRVAGPAIVIEYSPQQMGGNAANHIHGIYRDPTNDYGAHWTGVTLTS